LEKHLIRVKQKNTNLSKGQIVQKRSVDNTKRSNAIIEQFEQEYAKMQSEQDQRSMSINSRAQMIAEKHRIQQQGLEK
jgi:hypothetical protein